MKEQKRQEEEARKTMIEYMSTAELEEELSILMNNADENDNNDTYNDKKQKLRIATLRIALEQRGFKERAKEEEYDRWL